jgi:hypothetical protein
MCLNEDLLKNCDDTDINNTQNLSLPLDCIIYFVITSITS